MQGAREYGRPTFQAVREWLRSCRPDLAGGDIEYLNDGWDYWVYRAGDSVLRVPKREAYIGKLLDDQPLLAALGPTLPAPIPVPQGFCEQGPNGLPFGIYTYVPGVSLRDLTRPPSPDFGTSLGRFLKALHAFPVEKALALGLRVEDGSAMRLKRIEQFEDFARRGFSLLTCETRTYVAQAYETFLNDPRNFDFEPVLSHEHVDERNTLVDPETGELTGVIDFGDAVVGDPADDFTWAFCGGFAGLGIEDQLPDLLREGGLDASRLVNRPAFFEVLWPVSEILHGLDIGDQEFVELGVERLRAAVPRDVKCAEQAADV